MEGEIEMTDKEMKDHIEAIAACYKDNGYEVTGDDFVLAVEDEDGETIYAAQGEDKDNMEKEIEMATTKFDVSDEDALIWILDSAGAL
jgi:hypothetical protein